MRTTDEDGNVMYAFKDLLSQVVMQRVCAVSGGPSSDTYYIYNTYGSVAYALPLGAADGLRANGGVGSHNTYLQQYAYIYISDAYQCLTELKQRGCGPVYIVATKAAVLFWRKMVGNVPK